MDIPLVTSSASPGNALKVDGRQDLAHARAARLAARGRTAQAQETLREMVVCDVAGNLYGFEATSVASIIPLPDLTKVPQARVAVMGIFGRNGRIFTAVDLTTAMGFPAGDGASGHLVVMRHPRVRLAFRVDRALTLATLVVDSDPGAPAPVAQNVVSEYARAAGDDRDLGQHRIAILDSASLIQPFAFPSRLSGV